LLARFQREADVACRLEHANIVRAFRAGQANGLHYLVMEYLEGANLQEVLEKRGPLSPAEAIHVIHQALLGLEHLHEQGLVHRNLEPANLMLVPARKGDSPGKGDCPAYFKGTVPFSGTVPFADASSVLRATVKILDVSLSRSQFDEATTGTANNLRLTLEGQVVGIPDYLAPEQARDAHACDIRADIYSLGCILYHAMAGVPPYQDASVLGQVILHATQKPRPLNSFNAEVPDALQLIVDWMMAKDPAERYPTPARAAEALQFFLKQEEELEAKVAGQKPIAPSCDFPVGTGTALMDTPTTNQATNEENDLIFAPVLSNGRANPSFRRLAHSVRRDWLLLVLGGVGVLLAEVSGWLLAHLLHGWP
jgi:serine/threonine protein kinase